MATLGLVSQVDLAYLQSIDPKVDDLFDQDDIATDATSVIALAFDALKDDLLSKGKDPERILQDHSSRLKLTHAFLVFKILNIRNIKSEGDEFDRSSTKYEEAYKERLEILRVDYDYNNDGEIEEAEEDNRLIIKMQL